jgi:hypothetical protein
MFEKLKSLIICIENFTFYLIVHLTYPCSDVLKGVLAHICHLSNNSATDN